VARAGRAAQSVETRNRLLDAAVAVVATRGWEGATSRTLAAEAGVNLALINYHFQSKDNLLVAGLEHAMLRLEALGPMPVGGGAPDLADLHGVAGGFVAAVREAPEAQMLFEALLHARHNPQVAAAIVGHLEAFRAYATRCVQHSAGRSEPNAEDRGLGVALAAILDGLLLHALVDPTLDMRAALGALFGRLGVAGLGP